MIDQLQSQLWRLRVPLEDGGRTTYGTYTTEEEAAEAQARWRLTHLLPADDPQLVEAPSANMVVGGVRCDQWFERWQEAKAARRSRVRVDRKRGGAASTAARDRNQWKAWWSPAIGQALPQTVTGADISAIVDRMEAAGLAPLTIKTHWIMIKALFQWLVDEEVLVKNPLARTSVSIDPAQDRKRDIVVPDFRFIDLLTRKLHGTDRLIFELLLGTGGRRSEVAGLVVGDVDLAARRVWIRRPLVQVDGQLVRSPTPKGGRARAVVVGPQLADMLRRHLDAMGRVPADTPLLSSPRGGALRWENYMARVLRPAIRSAATRWAVGERRRLMNEGASRANATAAALEAAEKLTKLTPHHLRHTAAALLWAAGASDIEVQLILGHADVETSKSLYAHLLRGSEEDAAARVERMRFGL